MRAVVGERPVGLVVDRERFAQRDPVVPRIDDVLVGRDGHRRSLGDRRGFVGAPVVDVTLQTGRVVEIGHRVGDRKIGRDPLERDRIDRQAVAARGEERIAALQRVAVVVGREFAADRPVEAVDEGEAGRRAAVERVEHDRVGRGDGRIGAADVQIGAVPRQGRPEDRDRRGVLNVDAAAESGRGIVGDEGLADHIGPAADIDGAAVRGVGGGAVAGNDRVVHRQIHVFGRDRPAVPDRAVFGKRAVLNRQRRGAGSGIVGRNRAALSGRSGVGGTGAVPREDGLGNRHIGRRGPTGKDADRAALIVRRVRPELAFENAERRSVVEQKRSAAGRAVPFEQGRGDLAGPFGQVDRPAAGGAVAGQFAVGNRHAAAAEAAVDRAAHLGGRVADKARLGDSDILAVNRTGVLRAVPVKGHIICRDHGRFPGPVDRAADPRGRAVGRGIAREDRLVGNVDLNAVNRAAVGGGGVPHEEGVRNRNHRIGGIGVNRPAVGRAVPREGHVVGRNGADGVDRPAAGGRVVVHEIGFLQLRDRSVDRAAVGRAVPDEGRGGDALNRSVNRPAVGRRAVHRERAAGHRQGRAEVADRAAVGRAVVHKLAVGDRNRLRGALGTDRNRAARAAVFRGGVADERVAVDRQSVETVRRNRAAVLRAVRRKRVPRIEGGRCGAVQDDRAACRRAVRDERGSFNRQVLPAAVEVDRAAVDFGGVCRKGAAGHGQHGSGRKDRPAAVVRAGSGRLISGKRRAGHRHRVGVGVDRPAVRGAVPDERRTGIDDELRIDDERVTVAVDCPAVGGRRIVFEDGVARDGQRVIRAVDRAAVGRLVPDKRTAGNREVQAVGVNRPAVGGGAVVLEERILHGQRVRAGQRAGADRAAARRRRNVLERQAVEGHIGGCGDREDLAGFVFEDDPVVPVDIQIAVVVVGAEDERGVPGDLLRIDLHRRQAGGERHSAVGRVVGVGIGAGHAVVAGKRAVFGLLEVDGQRFAQRDQVVERIDDVLIGRNGHRRLFGAFPPFVRAVVVDQIVRTRVPRQVFRRVIVRFDHAGHVDRHRTLGERVIPIGRVGEECVTRLQRVVVRIADVDIV